MQTAHTTYQYDPLMTEIQAADVLNLSVRTLQTWRSKRVGPPFIPVGRSIRYRYADLVTWITEQTVCPSRTPTKVTMASNG